MVRSDTLRIQNLIVYVNDPITGFINVSNDVSPNPISKSVSHETDNLD